MNVYVYMKWKNSFRQWRILYKVPLKLWVHMKQVQIHSS